MFSKLGRNFDTKKQAILKFIVGKLHIGSIGQMEIQRHSQLHSILPKGAQGNLRGLKVKIELTTKGEACLH